MRLSISEIVNKACKLDTDQEKIDWLKSNNNIALKTILKYTYDSSIEFLIPNTPPPWKKNGLVGIEGMLYNEARRLKIFIKGGGYDNLNKTKREHLFIGLLEAVDNNDAELLCKMIEQQPLNGLPKNVVVQAFPDIFPIENQIKS